MKYWYVLVSENIKLCTFSCDFIKRMFFVNNYTRHERSNHQDTLAPSSPASVGHSWWYSWIKNTTKNGQHWLGWSLQNLGESTELLCNDVPKKTKCKTSGCIYLPSSIVCVAWGQLPSCSWIPQQSLPIRSPAHISSKPSQTSVAILSATVRGDAYLCLLMSAADD